MSECSQWCSYTKKSGQSVPTIQRKVFKSLLFFFTKVRFNIFRFISPKYHTKRPMLNSFWVEVGLISNKTLWFFLYRIWIGSNRLTVVENSVSLSLLVYILKSVFNFGLFSCGVGVYLRPLDSNMTSNSVNFLFDKLNTLGSSFRALLVKSLLGLVCLLLKNGCEHLFRCRSSFHCYKN